MKIFNINPPILESCKSRFRQLKRVLLLIFFLQFFYSAYSQSLSLFDIDTTNHPVMKVKFYAFDKDGNQVLNFNTNDFEITENGEIRKIISVSCPAQKLPKVVSVAMSIDVSGSMAYSGTSEIPVELGKITAKEICGKVSMPPSEFALQTCDSRARILQDFTSDRNVILTKIEPIEANGDNDFVEHLLNPSTGLLNIAKTGKHDKVAILYTDAWWYSLKDVELKQCIDTCQKYGIRFFAIIYTRPEAQSDGIKKSLQSLADATGGILFDGVTTKIAAREIGALLQSYVQETEPCTIEWESAPSCVAGITNVEFRITNLNLTATTNLKTGAWCYYNNDPANGDIYGKLYNWYTVNDPRGLAPEGWHIPSDKEWTELEDCLGGSSVAGGKLKSTGTIQGGDGLWYRPNTGATNESGFSALPGGDFFNDGTFNHLSYCGIWWSTTDIYTALAYVRLMNSDFTSIRRLLRERRDGYSVRCVKD